MPTITIDKKDLLSLIGKDLSDEFLKDRISMLGTDLEKVDDKEIIVEIFPNRPDLLSTEGLARALSSFLGIKTGLRYYKINNSNYEVKIDEKTKKARPCVSCAVIKNIKLDNPTIKSLMQIQEKLHTTHGRNRKKASIGIYNLDKIKFPLTYTTKRKDFKFTPLETNEEMSLNEILIKHPKGRDYAHLLENYNEYPIWIDSNKQVLSMPPIINSEETKVDEKTKNLFIDCTGFNQETVEKAVNIIVTNLADRNAEIYEVKINNKSFPNLIQKKLKFNKTYINKRLGLNLSDKEVSNLLEKMGLSVKDDEALIPNYRADIISQVDLIEDIAIAYGYENFEIKIPNVSTIANEDDFEVFKNKLSNLLTNNNLLETNTYNLTNDIIQNKNMLTNNPSKKVINAVNIEYDDLRFNILPSLLEVLSNNKRYEYPHKIFEIGNVFRNNEEFSLGILLTYSKVTYTEIKQILDSLFLDLGLKYKLKPEDNNSFIPGRCASILVNNKELGIIGEINPQVINNFNLNYPVVALELNVSELFKIKR